MSRKVLWVFICMLWCLLSAGAAWADGAVYAMTNALDNNQILAYHRDASGNLSLVQTAATGGGGSGLQLAGVDSLGSAGSLQLDRDHRFLFAVNAESAAENNGSGAYNTDCQQGTITSFRVGADGTLTFADRVFSGGLFPNSLAVTTRRNRDDDDHRRDADRDRDGDDTGIVVYALNAGGPEVPICHLTPGTANTPNITGFRVDAVGHLIPLDVTRPIGPGPATGPAGGVSCTAAAATGFSNLTGAPAADFQCGLNPPSFFRSPATVQFTPFGGRLVVTVKGTNAIYIFPVDRDGKAGQPTILQAPGPALPTYFGIAFDSRGHLFVTETFGTATSIPKGGAGAVSSFTIASNNHLLPISSDVADGGTAACWIALDPLTERFAYVSNNLGDFRISLYAVTTSGVLKLLNATAATGAGPNDLATAHENASSFLYVVDAATGTVGGFRILMDGSLQPVTGGGGLPANRSAQGLAAY